MCAAFASTCSDAGLGTGSTTTPSLTLDAIAPVRVKSLHRAALPTAVLPRATPPRRRRESLALPLLCCIRVSRFRAAFEIGGPRASRGQTAAVRFALYVSRTISTCLVRRPQALGTVFEAQLAPLLAQNGAMRNEIAQLRCEVQALKHAGAQAGGGGASYESMLAKCQEERGAFDFTCEDNCQGGADCRDGN